MPSPQTEEGYTRIANELLEALLRADLSKREWAIVLCVIRQTYGFHRKFDMLSRWQIAEMTGIQRGHVASALDKLLADKILQFGENARHSHGVEVREIGLNKDYSEWADRIQNVDRIQNRNGIRNGSQTVYETGQQPYMKRNTHKENQKKTKRKTDARPRACTFGVFLDACQRAGEKAIPPDDPIFDYAAEIGLPGDFLSLAWDVFAERFSEEGSTASRKTYKGAVGWRAAFRNYIRNGYLNLWRIDGDGEYVLTTAGKQARLRFGGKHAA